MERPGKTCKTCGTEFQKHPRSSYAQWAKAEFCSKPCRGRSLYKERQLCACGCGERVTVPRYRYLLGHNLRTGGIWYLRGGKKPRWMVNGRNGHYLWARIVMQNRLGRELLPTEVVHHINGDSTDDRLENLALYSSPGEHIRAEYYAGRLRINGAPKGP